MSDQLAVSPFQTYGNVIPRQQYVPSPYTPQYPVMKPPTVWDTYRSMFAPQPEPYSPMQSAVTGLRHNGEGMVIAALLALAHRHFGTLDIKGKYPVDGIIGALLLALSVREAGKPDGYAGDLRALSQSCTSVMVFRKLAGVDSKPTPELPAAKPTNATSDPILDAARAAGF